MTEYDYAAVAYRGTYGRAAPSGESDAGETLANIALVGAVVGGSAAAAQNALRLNRDEIELREALLSTGRTAIASAAATAVASAVAGAVAKQGVLRLSVMFGVGAAMLYGFNHWIDGEGEADE